MSTVEERVDRLEEALMKLTYVQLKTEMEIQSLKKEMKEFKDEMKDFKEEMRAFKDEMKDFKDEMRAFKDEMKDFKEYVKEEHKRMNKQWGALANKMGTIVADIIYPSTRPVIEKYFNCEITEISMNIRRKRKDVKDEYDVLAISDDTQKVFIIEVKSSSRKAHVEEFLNKKIPKFQILYPEYKNYKIIPILATLRFEKEMVDYLTERNIYAMAYKEWEYMDILNINQVKI